LNAVQGDTLRAFLFYLPNNDTGVPPLPNDNAWLLNDGGQWKTSNHFPVYAIPGAAGHQIVTALSQYSDNVTNAPFGSELLDSGELQPDDFLRLAADIDIGETSCVQRCPPKLTSTAGGGNNLPSLWIFLLIVLGILVVIVGITSIVMHLIQYRRREGLRNRILRGEVDLETVGIKRMTVPQEILDKMPLYLYTVAADQQAPSQAQDASESSKETDSIPTLQRRHTDPFSQSNPQAQHAPPTFNQPTCAICLDDFIPLETNVRELPCQHVFHPECVDDFLRTNSSLCPLCKKSVLPKGYCPTAITNAMVRRERLVRLRGERVIGAGGGAHDGPTSPDGLDGAADHRNTYHHVRFGGTALHVPRVRTVLAGGRRVFSAPARTNHASSGYDNNDVEMRAAVPTPPLQSPPPAAVPPPRVTATEEAPPSSADGGNPGRREWARQRALNMLGRRADVPSTDEEIARAGDVEARMPGWRRGVARVFPSVAA